MSKVKISELPASQAVKASSGGIIVTAGKCTVDNIDIDGNAITSTSGDITITPTSGSKIVLDGTINIDAGVVTGATSITSTAFTGALTGNVTGNVSGTAATVTTAAQPAITSVGTLTALQVDNLNVNGNTISATTGAVNITPEAGSAIVLDGTINIDAGVVTGATSITSTAFTGALTGNASTATALATGRLIGGVTFDGTGNIVPQTVQSINEASDTTCFPLFISASGSQSLQPLNNAALTFNASTAELGSTLLKGTVTTAAQPTITSLGTLTGLTIKSGTGSTTIKPSGSVIANHTDVSNVGAGEDTLMTDDLAANTFVSSGQFIEWEVCGISANNANSKVIKVYFGSTVVATITQPTSLAASWWEAKITIFRTGTSAQKWKTQVKRIFSGGGTVGANTVGTCTEDETAIITFKTTGEAVSDADITQQKSIVKTFGG